MQKVANPLQNLSPVGQKHWSHWTEDGCGQSNRRTKIRTANQFRHRVRMRLSNRPYTFSTCCCYSRWCWFRRSLYFTPSDTWPVLVSKIFSQPNSIVCTKSRFNFCFLFYFRSPVCSCLSSVFGNADSAGLHLYRSTTFVYCLAIVCYTFVALGGRPNCNRFALCCWCLARQRSFRISYTLFTAICALLCPIGRCKRLPPLWPVETCWPSFGALPTNCRNNNWPTCICFFQLSAC